MGYKEMHDEVNAVKAEVSDLKSDVASIKTQVTNHLPHALEDIKVALTTFDENNKEQHAHIEARLQPVETKFMKSTGVSEFLSSVVKVATALAAVTWTVIQILKVAKVF
jgi:hypothetical protein